MLSSFSKEISIAVGAAAALGLAAGGFAYASKWPGSQLFGRTLIAPPRPAELALTFDDGPNPACTPQLLDILGQYSVQATFFMLGRFAQQEPALTQRVAHAGHLIGNHSWSHPNLALTAAHRVRDELTRAKDTLEQIIAKPVLFFRPPFGARRPYVLREARMLGMTPVLWNAMTSDWKERSPVRIVERLTSKIAANQRRGLASNIVLHDGGHEGLNAGREPTIAAVDRLLATYTNSFRFVTVDAWAVLSEASQP